jgi:hypothetical protein
VGGCASEPFHIDTIQSATSKRLAKVHRVTHSTSPGCSTTVDASAFVANGYIILAFATELLRSIIENRSRKCVPVSSVYWYSHGVWSGANRTNSFVPQICVIKLFFLKSAVTRARADILTFMMVEKFSDMMMMMMSIVIRMCRPALYLRWLKCYHSGTLSLCGHDDVNSDVCVMMSALLAQWHAITCQSEAVIESALFQTT